MERIKILSSATLLKDLSAGLVVFLVALPLSLGVALASGAPLFSGVLAGIVGGVLVGMLSGSHTSVSGPAVGLTAIVSVEILSLGAFETFLLAVVVAGAIQIALGALRVGFLSTFVPSSVIQGLLAAIGVILILKQVPHLLGHDSDPEGDMAFSQPDRLNTLTELLTLFNGEVHYGAMTVGLLSITILVIWENVRFLKALNFPLPLVMVVMGVLIAEYFRRLGVPWAIEESHLVQMPVAKDLAAFAGFLQVPDFSQWNNPAVYTVGITIAVVASLETLLNLEAVDKLDPQQRNSPASRELVAQGIGNVTSGLIGGIPITSMIIRSSVNINAGGATKVSAIFHGVLLLACALLMPALLNRIPLSCLAAILLVTGVKLASPLLFFQSWRDGPYRFIPFIVTLIAIVLTDLTIGVAVGLAVSVAFILNSSFRRPMHRIVERHVGGDVTRVVFANQVSFLNRAALDKVFNQSPRDSQLLLDASSTDYIDPDILSMIREFKDNTAPIRGIHVSLRGFREKYRLYDDIQYIDYSTRALQDTVSPAQVLTILREGNERFRTGRRLTRDLGRQVEATAKSQHPWAVVLSCIDSRSPAELIFDLGLGDIFSVRMAGNVSSPKVLGSLEYGSSVAGAKLILVLGHTGCGAVTAAVTLACSGESAASATGCDHLQPIVHDIQLSVDMQLCRRLDGMTAEEKSAFVDAVARQNVLTTVEHIVNESRAIRRLVEERRVAVVGAMYDIATGRIDFLTERAFGLTTDEINAQPQFR